MAGIKGVNCFLIARYIVFGLFIICNAITCSVAVWNSSLVRSTQLSQVDIYLIFLGASSLVSIFILIFIELLCVNAVTTRVWFECAWIALFWIMQLAGGAALIAIESNMSCVGQATALRDAICTSEHMLLAFTWICTTMLLIYLLALVYIAMSHHHEVPTIWDSDVRTLCAAALQQCSLNTPTSPLTIRFKKRASVDIYIPQPVRPQPVKPFHYRGNLSAEYEIEPFRPVTMGPEQMDVPHSSNLPEAIPLPPLPAAPIVPCFMKPIPALPRDTANTGSLSLGHFDLPRGLASSIVYSSSASRPSGPVPIQGSSLPSPPPLGDWPRQDVMQQPVRPRPKRKSPPPSASEFPKKHMVMIDRASVPIDTVTQPRPRRPSGPRLRLLSVDNGRQPAPLDLSGISNYEIGRRD